MTPGPRPSICVVGCGYVGLSVALAFARAGFDVLGVEADAKRLEAFRRGENPVPDVEARDLDRPELRFSSDIDSPADVYVICVPTPLREGSPDLSFVEEAAAAVAGRLKRGDLVVLESTTYPGTTEELLRPILERLSGLAAGDDFNLAHSPERIDPGNRVWGLLNTPKVVGGLTPACTDRAGALYGHVCETVVRVSSPRAAEITKLWENSYRQVNIALANEMAMVCHDFEIDPWEVVDAAATKPFGFTPFRPGPGVGGHCFPPGTPVTMADGSERPIETVAPGDLVLTGRGRARMVEATFARWLEGKLMVVRPRGLEPPLRCTPDHRLWSALRRRDDRDRWTFDPPGWVPAEELNAYVKRRQSHRVAQHATPVSVVSPGESIDLAGWIDVAVSPDGQWVFPSTHSWQSNPVRRFIDVTPGLARLIGLFAAEGSTDGRTGHEPRRTKLSFGTQERDLVYSTAKLVEETFGVEPMIRELPKQNVTQVVIGSKIVTDVLSRFAGSGVADKRLAPSIFAWDEELLGALWDGFLDGDGYRGADGQIIATTVSAPLARDLYRILVLLGRSASIRTYQPGLSPGVMSRRPLWQVNELRRPRTRHEGHALIDVMEVSAEPYAGPVYNLQVAEDRSYIANTLVVSNCIGIDPQYLAWRTRGKAGRQFRLIETSNDINGRMPSFVAQRAAEILNEEGKAMRGSSVLILGVAFKGGSGDVRESPSLIVAERLTRSGARVAYHDPFVPEVEIDGTLHRSVELSEGFVAWADIVLILTDHPDVDYETVVHQARCVYDMRGVTSGVPIPEGARVYRT